MIDGNIRLKYIAYCTSQLPPEGAVTDYEDIVRFAKFQLCKKSNRLMKDPIWDTYTDEEILIEHYAHNFSADEDARTNFEKEFMLTDKQIDDWIVEESQKGSPIELEDRISFNPDSMGEE